MVLDNAIDILKVKHHIQIGCLANICRQCAKHPRTVGKPIFPETLANGLQVMMFCY